MGLEVPDASKQVWHPAGGFGVDHVRQTPPWLGVYHLFNEGTTDLALLVDEAFC